MRAFFVLVLVACTGNTESLPAFGPPDMAPVTGSEYPWAFYDTPDHGSTFLAYAPQFYARLDAKPGSKFVFTATAMTSTTQWTPDPDKHLDGAVLEATATGDGTFTWRQLARASSTEGVLTLSAQVHDAAIYFVGVEASADSYDQSLSPSVSFTFDLACDASSHDACAAFAQPGDACTISPDSCEAPYAACIAASGTCAPTGTCQRLDMYCDGLLEPVCGCDGMTYQNECQATEAKASVRHDGACP